MPTNYCVIKRTCEYFSFSTAVSGTVTFELRFNLLYFDTDCFLKTRLMAKCNTTETPKIENMIHFDFYVSKPARQFSHAMQIFLCL